jgi:hypothetical protein
MIAPRLPVISARDDPIAVDEDSSNGRIRAGLSQSLLRFGEGGAHEFFMRSSLRHR